MNVRLGLAQINTTVGDLDGNYAKILEYLENARAAGVDILAFPELTLTGYPPEDLVFRKDFLKATRGSLDQIIPHVRDIVVIVGFVEEFQGRTHNSAAVICDGQIVGVYRKHFLPNYGVFDELRYFQPGEDFPIFTDGNLSFGVTICEDLWRPGGPVSALARAGAQLIVNLSASPYEIQKGFQRESLLAKRTTEEGVALALCNLVGGQDELILDGQSLIYGKNGKMLARAKAFDEDLLMADLSLKPFRNLQASKDISVVRLPRAPASHKSPSALRIEPELDEDEAIYHALVLATKDYLRKNGFQRVIIGLSGGVDSSLVACIAVDALGPQNVTGVFLPARFTSKESREDVEELVQNLKINLFSLDMDPIYEAALKALAPAFAHTKPETTEENLQARLRAVLWMALSNKFDALVLTAGNKSELAIGYATLYGDMAGGFSVLKDVTKTRVYQLARWRNLQAEVIPKRVLERAPTAELRFHQTDEADLPLPYRELDRVIEAFVERNESAEQIARDLDLSEESVRRVLRLITQSEYKRRQAPVGPKITKRAFGRDWRQPISKR